MLTPAGEILLGHASFASFKDYDPRGRAGTIVYPASGLVEKQDYALVGPLLDGTVNGLDVAAASSSACFGR